MSGGRPAAQTREAMMAVINIGQSVYQIGTNIPAITLAAVDTLNLSSFLDIFAAGTGIGAHGIQAAGSNMPNIYGNVYSREADGIFGVSGNDTISITATGSVYGLQYGIFLQAGSNTVTNFGDISG